MDKIHYERQYPELSLDELEKKIGLTNNINLPSSEEFLRHLINDSEYTPVKHRLENQAAYIQLAIEVSELLQVDTKIYESFGSIRVNLVSPCMVSSSISNHQLSLLTDLSDDVTICVTADNEISMCFTYYTHERILDGKKMRNIQK